jgi:glycogen debranching enzyme
VAGDLIVLDGTTFFCSDSAGNVEPGEAEGFFYEDVRHLSRWRLSVRDVPLRVVTSRQIDYYSARIVLAPETGGEADGLSIVRDRFVTEGVHEDLAVRNDGERELHIRLDLELGSDFADLMQAQAEQENGDGRFSTRVGTRALTLDYSLDGYRRGTAIAFRKQPRLSRTRAVFDLRLAPRGEWKTCIDVTPLVEGDRRPPLLKCGSFARPAAKMPMSVEEWIEDAPTLDCSSVSLLRTYEQSLLDLASLRIRPADVHIRWAMPGGGIPWFMTVFGRDSLITAYEMLPIQADLAEATLEALASLQATEWDNYRDAEPGKIPHELRRGTFAKTGRIPHTPYYGTHDATPLFLILLDEYERWTGDEALVRRLEPNARAALAWIEGPGDLDADGYLEYRKRSESDHALENHCWKDSHDGVVWPDGRTVEPPIATCELQGYAYDARVRAARLAREAWRDDELAGRLERDAADLKRRFNRDFWLGARKGFAFALDGEKRHVDTLTSNQAHLLWSGIVDEDKARHVVQLLLRKRLFSGWGLRTLSNEHDAYDPLAYHRGTVWPHDTAIAAEGMRRYGFRDEATRVCMALLDAAAAFDHRLPEVFSGFEHDATGVPIAYPDALVPQSWSAAAPMLVLRTLLGLDVTGARLRTRPHMPPELGRVRLRGVKVRGSRRDVG